MDVVIPVGKEIVRNNIELRYCLRSIQKHVADVDKVFIIGHRPSFLRNIIHVPYNDLPERKFISLNIYRKLQKACLDERVSDGFYFFADDHFLLSDFVPAFYYCGTLEEALKKTRNDQAYHKTLQNTITYLNGGLNFNVHCPIVIQKALFLDPVVAACRWHTPHGFAIKSVYCNVHGLPGTFLPDLKIKMVLDRQQINSLIKGRPFFSTGHFALNQSMLDLFAELYPKKSDYES